MGTYTELIFEGKIKKAQYDKISGMLEFYFGNGEEPGKLPLHPLFLDGCWWMDIGHLCSYYHPYPSVIRKLKYDDIIEGYILFLRCDIKNYHEEIENFIDWLIPYMLDYRAIVWEEQEDSPKIYQGDTYD